MKIENESLVAIGVTPSRHLDLWLDSKYDASKICGLWNSGEIYIGETVMEQSTMPLESGDVVGFEVDRTLKTIKFVHNGTSVS